MNADMEWPMLMAVGGAALLCWLVFKQFSDWLVGKLLPSKDKATAMNMHFIQGLALLEEAHKQRNAGAKKLGDIEWDKNGSSRHHPGRKKILAAIEEFDKGILVDPRNADMRMMKCLALESLGDINGALRELTFILDDKPMKKKLPLDIVGGVYFKRGSLLLTKNRKTEAALKDAEAGLQFCPEDPQLLCLLGKCMETKKNWKRAGECFERALRYKSDLTDAKEGLARLQKDT
eukprot:TRINITY_DN8804_c0_g1_i1.p1 TRINITY_DN8804_c0_g1~~TRINITY_DN8804_c0_g1_i1.p1  ORF type:complete len:233 (-),score=36.66 TRINITY_DN8804_c0_g1_i1:371-1069(-)